MCNSRTMNINIVFEYLVFTLTFVMHDEGCIAQAVVQDYVESIQEQINSSIQYTLPISAREYEFNGQQQKFYGTFDFIIIGSGASGSVLANRLSEISKWRVLLLEAGTFGNDLVDIPNMSPAFIDSKYDWGFKSIPQNTSCLAMFEKKCFYPRGKGVGGSSLINGLMYVRGSSENFKTWGKNNPGWSYQDLLPFFKKSENFEKTDLGAVVDYRYHGGRGLLNVAYRVPRHPFANYWLRANQERGHKMVDYNGEDVLGVGLIQLMIKNGKRQHTGNAFIKSIKKRKNLTIMTNSYVTRIVIKNNKAIGVLFTQKGQLYFAKCNLDVIISAGVFGSAQLLMLSGIGPQKHLRKFNIQVIKDLQVGSTLRDHPTYWGLYFSANFTKSENTLASYVREYLRGQGTLTVPTENNGLGFYRSKLAPEGKAPDIELLIHPVDGFSRYLPDQLKVARTKQWVLLNQTGDFMIQVISQSTKSTGTVRLQSNNSFDYPLINSRLLSDTENVDIETLYEGIQIALDIALNTTVFREINTTLIRQVLPNCDDKQYLSKEYWLCALRWFTFNVYHPMGTCPMGPDPSKGAVVDAKAQVHGIINLRVVDASIYPNIVSGHPTSHCIMFGEKISHEIKKKYLKT